MIGNDLSVPPLPEEVEVSIFGPGYGECILIHVGHNEWIIIDSCIDRESGLPAPLRYFSQLSIDPALAVKLIIATHWHDDHIRGLSKVYATCTQAEFVAADALHCDEFITLAGAFGTRSMLESSGIDEFYDVLRLMQQRQSTNLRWAIADRVLWKRSSGESSDIFPCVIVSLSPSDNAVTKTKLELSRLLPQPSSVKGRIPAPLRNHSAVAVWAQVGDICILLGSDLEEASPTGEWSAVLKSSARPTEKAAVFKVPHHGSSDADCQAIWTEMLTQSPQALLTPFTRGDVRLPRKEDMRRILAKTPNAFITAMPTTKRLKHERMVEKTVRETVKAIRQAEPSTGHIRLRTGDIRKNNPFRVELIGGPLTLQEALSNYA